MMSDFFSASKDHKFGNVYFDKKYCNDLINMCGVEETKITPGYNIYHIDLNACEKKIKESTDNRIKEGKPQKYLELISRHFLLIYSIVKK